MSTLLFVEILRERGIAHSGSTCVKLCAPTIALAAPSRTLPHSPS
jgi:hypothetical protein